MPEHVSYREETRKNWGHYPKEGEKTDRDALKFGCLLRIADATERMAQRHTDLIDDRERYKRWHEEAKASLATERNRSRALRGHVNRLRRQLADALARQPSAPV